MNRFASPTTVLPLLVVTALVFSLGVLLGVRYVGRGAYAGRFFGAAGGAGLTALAGWIALGKLADRPAALGLAILLSGPALALLVTAGIAGAEALAGRRPSGFGLLRAGATGLTAALLWFIAFPALLGQAEPLATIAWASALAAVSAWTAAAYGPGRPARADR